MSALLGFRHDSEKKKRARYCLHFRVSQTFCKYNKKASTQEYDGTVYVTVLGSVRPKGQVWVETCALTSLFFSKLRIGLLLTLASLGTSVSVKLLSNFRPFVSTGRQHLKEDAFGSIFFRFFRLGSVALCVRIA